MEKVGNFLPETHYYLWQNFPLGHEKNLLTRWILGGAQLEKELRKMFCYPPQGRSIYIHIETHTFAGQCTIPLTPTSWVRARVKQPMNNLHCKGIAFWRTCWQLHVKGRNAGCVTAEVTVNLSWLTSTAVARNTGLCVRLIQPLSCWKERIKELGYFVVLWRWEMVLSSKRAGFWNNLCFRLCRHDCNRLILEF